MRTKRSSALLCVTLLLTACHAPTWALSLTTKEQENKMGEETYREILKKEKVNKDPVINAYVKRVARRVSAVAPDMGFKYEVSVLDSDNINAFCLPGGKICVYTGILPYCQNEAGLACVMSHEVAHATLRHGGKRMTQHTVVGLIGAGIEKVLQAQKVSGTTATVAMGAYGYGTQLGILLPYSRGHETEADDAGLEYMAKAGYDPREAPAFWGRFGTTASKGPTSSVATFFSTHPAHDDRADRLQSAQAKALKWYEKTPKYGRGEMIPKRYLKPIPGAPSKQSDAHTAAGSAPAPDRTTGLQDNEIRAALREALGQGARKAVALLGKGDGFRKNANVRLTMPADLKVVAEAVRKAGKEKRVEDFVKQLNRAAEKAVKEYDHFVTEAVNVVTFEKPRPILKGPPDAATQHLVRLTGAGLKQKFLSVIEEVNRKAGAAKAYKKMMRRGGPEGRKMLNTFDLNTHVANSVVDAVFKMIADEEREIRARPDQQRNESLKEVFGSVNH